MAFKIELRQSPHRAIAQTIPDYDVYLNGEKWGEIYYNMTGYVGYLPCPPNGSKLDMGESSLATYKREVSKLNREAKQMNL